MSQDSSTVQRSDESPRRLSGFEEADLATGAHSFIARVLSDDKQIRDLMRDELLDDAAVLQRAELLVGSVTTIDLIGQYDQLLAVERQRDSAITLTNGDGVGPAVIITVVSGLGFIVAIFGLLALVLAKALGHLRYTAVWPWVVAVGATLVASVGAALAAGQRRTARTTELPDRDLALRAERLETALRDQVRSLLLVPAIEELSSVSFVEPSADTIRLGAATHLSARVAASARIQTSSYRRLLLNLGRDGGATIGLAGTRGVGKSELLRAFCEPDPESAASLDSGGTIGFVIPAPVAYEPAAFVRLLALRLAEQVPGYRIRRGDESNRGATGLDLFALIVFIGCLAGGLSLSGMTKSHRLLLGSALLVIAAIILLWWSKFRGFDHFWRSSRQRWQPLQRRGSQDVTTRSVQLTRAARDDLGFRASQLAERIRYLETRASGHELSASIGQIGLKTTGSSSLGEQPMGEPELVAEFRTFVEELHAGNYRLIIGIDELDKQASGERAAEFLNGIKAVLDARHCSFLLSVSDNAFAQFARRGMPIRDVFDSALDDVIWIEHLNFAEGRRLVRARQVQTPGEQASDTQLLLCHTLAGGLPRDFLRYARRLAELAHQRPQEIRLSDVLSELLKDDLRSRVNGAIAAIQAKDDAQDSSAAIVELRALCERPLDATQSTECRHFLADDLAFAIRVGPSPGTAAALTEPALSWLISIRRQVYSYLRFAETVAYAFTQPAGFAAAPADLIDDLALLAEARRVLEIDPVAGWRTVQLWRDRHGLVS